MVSTQFQAGNNMASNEANTRDQIGRLRQGACERDRGKVWGSARQIVDSNFRNDAAAPKRRRKFGRHAEMGVMWHVRDMTLIIISVACETGS